MTDPNQPAARAAAGPDALPSPTDVDWQAVRLAYEASDLTVQEIRTRFRVAQAEIYRRIECEGWRPRQRQKARDRPGAGRRSARPAGREIDRAALVDRLFQVVERQIGDIEARLARATDTDAAPADDKDARALAALARTLELLIGLEKIAVPPAGPAEVDIDEFRADIARRLAGLGAQP
jgi:hypothetical protein